MTRLLRIVAAIACLALVVVLAFAVVSFVSPCTIEVGERALCLYHGAYAVGPYERIEASGAGHGPRPFFLLPPAADRPLWPLAVGTGLPAAALAYFGWRRIAPPGHCRACGYNLTGNVSGRCPECGEAISFG